MLSDLPRDPERFKHAKAFNLARKTDGEDYLAVESYLDAKDTVNKWCVAIVKNIEKDEETLLIGFDGWSSKYDVFVKRNSSKIAPFRLNTLGYTGQQNVAYRDFSINLAQLDYLQKRVREIVDSNFRSFKSAHDCTQFIRGELFAYVDTLLTRCENTTKEDLPAIFNFIELNFQLMLKWCTVVPSLIPAWKENQTCPTLFTVDLQAAISMCGFEISSVFGRLWGYCKRSKEFWKKFQSEYMYPGDFCRDERISTDGFQCSLTNRFGKIGGFDVISSFVQKSDIPLPLIVNILHHMKYLQHFVNDQLARDFGKKVCDSLTSRVNNMSAQEMKETDREVMSWTVNLIESFTKMQQVKVNQGQISETLSLQIAGQCLKSQLFELKIRGMNDFKLIFGKVQNRAANTDEQLQTKNLKYCHYLTHEIFMKYLFDNQVLEQIFVETPHPELIKRSLEMLYLRLTDSTRPTDQRLIDQIWDCCTQKHEAVAKATFNVVQDLIQYLPENVLELFWQRVKLLQSGDFDEIKINFLKRYTESTLVCLKRLYDNKVRALNTKHQQSGKGRKTPSVTLDCSKYLDLQVFWSIASEENQLTNQKTKDIAINALVDLAKTASSYQFQNLLTRLDFIKLALHNLKAGSNVHTSIQFIKRTVSTFPLDSTNIKFTGITSEQLNEAATRETVVKYLVKEQVFDIVLKNLKDYMHQIQTKTNMSLETKHKHFSHKEWIDVTLGLVEFVIVNSKSSNLDFDQLVLLYQTIVIGAVTDYEREQFYMFLTKKNENSQTRERKLLLDEKRALQLFQHIFCNQDMLNCRMLSATGFNCFQQLFLNLNAQQGNLQLGERGIFSVTKLSSLQGFESLWLITIFSQIDSVRDKARNFLADLYLNYKPAEKQLNDVVDLFLNSLISAQQKLTGANKTEYQNWLSVISTVIRRFEFEHIQEQSLTLFDQKQNIDVQVTLVQQSPISVTVKVNSNMRMWQLIIQIAKAFKIRRSEFRITQSTGLVPVSIYSNPIAKYNINTLQIKRLDDKTLDRELPRRNLAQNTKLINQILESISSKPSQAQAPESTVQEAFDLIELLPTNIDNKASLMQEISKMKRGNLFGQWCKTFDVDPDKLSNDHISSLTCYNLMLLLDIVQPSNSQHRDKSKDINEQWQSFIQTIISQGVLLFLVKIFNSVMKQKVHENVIKCCTLQTLLKLIEFLYQSQAQTIPAAETKTLFAQNLLLFQDLTQRMAESGALTSHRRFCELLDQTLTQIQKLLYFNPELTENLYAFDGFDQALIVIYTQVQDYSVQAKVSQRIFEICIRVESNTHDKKGDESTKSEPQELPANFIIKIILNQILSKCLENTENTKSYREVFGLLEALITQTGVARHLKATKQLDMLVTTIVNMIRERPLIEKSIKGNEEDCVLSGLFSVLTSILKVSAQAKSMIKNCTGLMHYLIHECLFLLDTKNPADKGRIGPPKCKTVNSRLKCLELIKQLCDGDLKAQRQFSDYLASHVFGQNIVWQQRIAQKTDWQALVDSKLEKSSTGYVGLRNLGCICYLNSILQNLYMIPQFRKAILDVPDKNMAQQDKTENCLYQLKRMFVALQHLNKQYYNPKKFCKAFKDFEGNSIDPRVQRDGDEFLAMLIDRVESLTKGTQEETTIKSLLYGAFVNEVICKGCPHVSEREEPFMAVQLQVKDKHSIQQSLDSFVEGEMLEGDNAYYCEKCDKKRDSLKRQTFRELPNVLIFNLKRFDFNYDTMSKFKINDFCEFPRELDMRRYTQEEIKKNELQREIDEKNLSFDDLDEDQQLLLKEKYPSSYYQYELGGIVVHTGTTESGHYYSFIKERSGSNQWFSFNDKEVHRFNPDQIPTECFGGDDPDFDSRLQQYAHDVDMQQAIAQQGRVKTKNAYILFYERKQMLDTQQSHSGSLSDQDLRTGSIQDEIDEKNKRFWLTKFIFNKPFIEHSCAILRPDNSGQEGEQAENHQTMLSWLMAQQPV